MNQNFKKLISAATLLCSAMTFPEACSTCPTTCGTGQNTWQPHAFNASMGREVLVGKHAWVAKEDGEGWHGHFSVAGEYDRTFKQSCTNVSGCCKSLGSLPLWASNNSNSITAGNNSGEYDLDLYQIGMGAVDTDAGKLSDTIILNPLVYQAGADFFLYVGSHQTERGFFLKMHAPVGVISVNPQFYHTNNIASANYPVGALNQGASLTDTVAAPNTTLDDAFQNPKGNGFLKAMNKGLIGCKRTSSAKFGDFEASLGYNIVADEKKHLGLAVRFSAPTGNKAEAIYMLEPIFGRNGHWGAGGEIIGHWKFWESDTDDKYAQVVFDGDALHLFNSTTMRSFDLAGNGSGSKYLLLGKYAGTPGVFQNEIVNAVNVTTISTQSSFAIEGNFALAFDFHWNNFSFALGYEGWGRSCEKLKINCGCPGSINYNDYAVLGRQQPFLRTAAFTAINLCQPNATIGESLDYVAALPVGVSEIKDATLSASRLSETDALDVDGQRARSVYTNKPFAQIQYTWRDSDYNPYLAVSGGAEIPSGKNQNSAARFWNIGVQGGLAF